MKKILFSLVALATLTVSAQAFFSGPLSAPTTGKLIQPTHEYEIDTWGSNSEIYEFTPCSNTGKSCVVFILDSGKSTSMQCFDKPQTVKK